MTTQDIYEGMSAHGGVVDHLHRCRGRRSEPHPGGGAEVSAREGDGGAAAGRHGAGAHRSERVPHEWHRCTQRAIGADGGQTAAHLAVHLGELATRQQGVASR